MSVAPKAAIEALITGIAKEEGRNNIRANTVLLGVIEAGMFLELTRQGVFDDKWVAKVQENLALKRWGKPEEVGYAAVLPRLEPRQLRHRAAHPGRRGIRALSSTCLIKP